MESTFYGAGNQNRTDDLVITNDVLYRLSHTSVVPSVDDFDIITNHFRFVNTFFQFFSIFLKNVFAAPFVNDSFTNDAPMHGIIKSTDPCISARSIMITKERKRL